LRLFQRRLKMADGQDSISKSTGGGADLALGIAKRGIAEVYSINLMSALSTHKQYCANLQSGNDPALIAVTRSCIAAIADDKVRANLFDAFDAALDAIYRLQGADQARKGHLVVKVCTAAVGECYSWADQFLGLTKINCLVPLHIDPPKEDEQVEQYEEPNGETDPDPVNEGE
jgi:hypothetical protein